jgi:hypothetical protein
VSTHTSTEIFRGEKKHTVVKYGYGRGCAEILVGERSVSKLERGTLDSPDLFFFYTR